MTSTDQLPATSDAKPVDRSLIERLLTWLGLSTLAALVVGWLAFQVKAGGLAPEVLYPLSVGVILGVSLVAALRASGWPMRRLAIVATVFWTGLALTAQEFTAYQHYRRQYAQLQQRSDLSAFARAAAAELEPAGFGSFVSSSIDRRGRAWWTLDVVLTLAAALTVVGCQGRGRATPAREGTSATPQDQDPSSTEHR